MFCSSLTSAFISGEVEESLLIQVAFSSEAEWYW